MEDRKHCGLFHGDLHVWVPVKGLSRTADKYHTFENDSNDPSLLLRSGPIVYPLQDFGLDIPESCVRSFRVIRVRNILLPHTLRNLVEDMVEVVDRQTAFNN